MMMNGILKWRSSQTTILATTSTMRLSLAALTLATSSTTAVSANRNNVESSNAIGERQKAVEYRHQHELLRAQALGNSHHKIRNRFTHGYTAKYNHNLMNEEQRKPCLPQSSSTFEPCC